MGNVCTLLCHSDRLKSRLVPALGHNPFSPITHPVLPSLSPSPCVTLSPWVTHIFTPPSFQLLYFSAAFLTICHAMLKLRSCPRPCRASVTEKVVRRQRGLHCSCITHFYVLYAPSLHTGFRLQHLWGYGVPRRSHTSVESRLGGLWGWKNASSAGYWAIYSPQELPRLCLPAS